MPLSAVEKSAALCEYHWTVRKHDVRVAASTGCTCWEGYERVPGTKPCAPGSCRKKKKSSFIFSHDNDGILHIEDPDDPNSFIAIDDDAAAQAAARVEQFKQTGMSDKIHCYTCGYKMGPQHDDMACRGIYLRNKQGSLEKDADINSALEAIHQHYPAMWDIVHSWTPPLVGAGISHLLHKTHIKELFEKFKQNQENPNKELDLSSAGKKESISKASFNKVVAQTMRALNYLDQVAYNLPPRLAGFFQNIRERAHSEGNHLLCRFENCDLMKNAHAKDNHRYCNSTGCDKWDRSMFRTYWSRLVGIQHEMGYHTACDPESCAPKRDSHNIGLHEHCGVECPSAPDDIEVARAAEEPFGTDAPAETELTKQVYRSENHKKVSFVPSMEEMERLRNAAHEAKNHLLCDFDNCELMNGLHRRGDHSICTPSNCDDYDRLSWSRLWYELIRLEHQMGFHHMCDPEDCNTRNQSHRTDHKWCGIDCPDAVGYSTRDDSDNSGLLKSTSLKTSVDSTHPFGFKTDPASFRGRIDDRDGTEVQMSAFNISEDSTEIGRPSSPKRETGFGEEIESFTGTDDDDDRPYRSTEEVETDGDDDEQDTDTRDQEDIWRQGRDK